MHGYGTTKGIILLVCVCIVRHTAACTLKHCHKSHYTMMTTFDLQSACSTVEWSVASSVTR